MYKAVILSLSSSVIIPVLGILAILCLGLLPGLTNFFGEDLKGLVGVVVLLLDADLKLGLKLLGLLLNGLFAGGGVAAFFLRHLGQKKAFLSSAKNVVLQLLQLRRNFIPGDILINL
jgi:hypothetical protein